MLLHLKLLKPISSKVDDAQVDNFTTGNIMGIFFKFGFQIGNTVSSSS